MRVVRRIVAVIFALIAAFLIYAVIHATQSAGGAKISVAVAYIAGAVILLALAGLLWRDRTRRSVDVSPRR